MAVYRCGNMWDVWGNTDLFCITTNSTIKQDGSLVMGRGIARQAKDRFPELPYKFARNIQHKTRNQDDKSLYGLVITVVPNAIGAFQVKNNYRGKAELLLIRYSTTELFKAIVVRSPLLQLLRVDLNFPGIGNGMLSIDEVFPIVNLLPDDVTIWVNDENDLQHIENLGGTIED